MCVLMITMESTLAATERSMFVLIAYQAKCEHNYYVLVVRAVLNLCSIVYQDSQLSDRLSVTFTSQSVNLTT